MTCFKYSKKNLVRMNSIQQANLIQMLIKASFKKQIFKLSRAQTILSWDVSQSKNHCDTLDVSLV